MSAGHGRRPQRGQLLAAHTWVPDLVKRNFKASRPDGELEFGTDDPAEFFGWLEDSYPIVLKSLRLELAAYGQLDYTWCGQPRRRTGWQQ